MQYTLIELIVVIVILGILAVSAAPRFINLQSDARAATLNAMMGAVKSANSLILGKAVIHGVNTKYSEKEAGGTGNWTDDCSVDNCVNIGQMWVYLKYAYIDRNSAKVRELCQMVRQFLLGTMVRVMFNIHV